MKKKLITVLAFIFMDSVTLQRTNSYYFWYLKRFLFFVSKYNNKKKKNCYEVQKQTVNS